MPYCHVGPISFCTYRYQETTWQASAHERCRWFYWDLCRGCVDAKLLPRWKEARKAVSEHRQCSPSKNRLVNSVSFLAEFSCQWCKRCSHRHCRFAANTSLLQSRLYLFGFSCVIHFQTNGISISNPLAWYSIFQSRTPAIKTSISRKIWNILRPYQQDAPLVSREVFAVAGGYKSGPGWLPNKQKQEWIHYKQTPKLPVSGRSTTESLSRNVSRSWLYRESLPHHFTAFLPC